VRSYEYAMLAIFGVALVAYIGYLFFRSCEKDFSNKKAANKEASYMRAKERVKKALGIVPQSDTPITTASTGTRVSDGVSGSQERKGSPVTLRR